MTVLFYLVIMNMKPEDLAARLLDFMRQTSGDRLPAGFGLEQARELAAQYLSSAGGDGATPSLAKLTALVATLRPIEDPRDPKVRKRRRILQAATALFVKNGYRKTSLDEVARAAGVAKGTLYLYFKSKPDLLMQAVSDEKMRYASTLHQALRPEMSGREQLRAWLGVFLQGLREMPLTARMIGGDREVLLALEEIDAQFKLDTMALQHDFVAGLIARACAPAALDDATLQGRARVLLAVLYSSGALLDERLRAGLDVETFARHLVDVLVDGVAGNTDGGSS
jgi:TetR/AcrR family fatty acid metabolism transcriptional regulator